MPTSITTPTPITTPVSILTLLPILLTITVAILTIYLIVRFLLPRSKKYLLLLIRAIISDLHETYFCGFHFDHVCRVNFFRRFGKIMNYGFCGAAAGLSMLALRKNRTARLVEIHCPSEDEDPYWWHRVVEFRFMCVWFVLDPAWLRRGLMLRKNYYEQRFSTGYTIAHVCKHREFWSYRFSKEMFEKLRRPETSWQLFEINKAYNCEEGCEDFFGPDLKNLSADWSGKYPSLHFHAYQEGMTFILIPRIVRELMARPSRRQPKARTIRLARKTMTLIRRQYDARLAAEREARNREQRPDKLTASRTA